MVDIALGAQARIHDYSRDAALNGRAGVCMTNGASGRATVRLSTGREIVLPVQNLDVVAPAGALPPGTQVILAGLQKSPELNGRFGTVAPSPSPPAGRLLIEFQGLTKALKFENFIVVDPDAVARNPSVSGAFARGVKVTIKNFVDPGIDGMVGVVLGKDPHDPARLMLMLPCRQKVMTFRPDNLAPAGEASGPEMREFLAPLREAFQTEVRKFLWGVPHEKVLLSSLTSMGQASGASASQDSPWSSAGRLHSSWAALQGAWSDAMPPMYNVLRERTDLFESSFDASGRELLGLSEGGRSLNISEGVPEPPAKRRKMDMDSGKFGKDELARAFFTALKLCATEGQAVPLSQLGNDHAVAQLRKDPHFAKHKYRLADILLEYPNVFELTPDAVNGGWMVKLTGDAEVALPQRVAGETAPEGSGDVLPDPEKLKLPDKLDSPETMSDKLQALRVELIHALFRRGGRAEPGSLGQEAGVQKFRKAMPKSKTLMDLVRVFPANFTVALDETAGKLQVHLDCMDVSDMSPIEGWLGARR